MATNRAANIKISPVDVTWEIEEKVCVDVAGISAATLDGVSFGLSDATTEYYVWFNLDAGSTDPAVAGKTGIEVAVATGDSEAVMAAAIEAAVEAATTYEGSVDSSTVAFVLDTTDVVVSAPADINSGIEITRVNTGSSTYLGLLDGTVEPNFEETTKEITAHQFGTSVLTELRQGNSADVSLSLKECTKGIYQAIVLAGGGTFTPSAPGSTELYGWGDNKQGANTIVDARRLVLHPVGEGTSKLRDLTFWLAYPKLSSIVFSGEDEQLMNIDFTTYLDETKPSGIKRYAIGDSSQELV